MMKILVVGVLAVVVAMAGFVAAIPVYQAHTVHLQIISNVGTIFCRATGHTNYDPVNNVCV